MERARRLLVCRCGFVPGALELAVVGALGAIGVGCALDPSGTLPSSTASTGASVTSAQSSSSASGSGGMGGTASGTGGMAQGSGGSGTGGTTTSSSSAGGGGAGGGGTGGGGPTYIWDAQTATMNPDGTWELPPWLVFASPTPNKTSQTSASTLKTGFGPDAPRARNVTGMQADWGLSIESTRKNTVHYSDSWYTMWASLATGSMTAVPMQADPAGGTTATLFQSAGNQSSYYFIAKGRTASGWLRGQGTPGDPGMPGGPLSYAHFRHADISGAPYKEVDSTEWTRYSVTNTGDQDAAIALETKDRPPGSGSITTATEILAYGGQVEAGVAYPSSYIPTTSADITRDAETLSSPMITTLVPNGFFRIELRFAPNYASGEQAGDHDLLFFKDGNNHLFLRSMDRSIVLRLTSQEVVSDALEWSREQELTVIAVNTATERSLTVLGATNGNGTKTQMMGTAAALGNTLYILGNASGAQECADLRYISFTTPP